MPGSMTTPPQQQMSSEPNQNVESILSFGYLPNPINPQLPAYYAPWEDLLLLLPATNQLLPAIQRVNQFISLYSFHCSHAAT